MPTVLPHYVQKLIQGGTEAIGLDLPVLLWEGAAKQNAFALGIALGRAESNDLPIDDVSVSRFHAYFQRQPKIGWALHDADSANGTWIGALRLKDGASVPIPDKSRLRFGDVEMTFYEPKTFVALMQNPPGR